MDYKKNEETTLIGESQLSKLTIETKDSSQTVMLLSTKNDKTKSTEENNNDPSKINFNADSKIDTNITNNTFAREDTSDNNKVCIVLPIKQHNEFEQVMNNDEETSKIVNESYGDKHGSKTNGHYDFDLTPKLIDVKRSSMRHVVALMALSSIILANMNRQAFNVSMPNMIKIKAKPTTNKQTNQFTDLSSSCPWPDSEKILTIGTESSVTIVSTQYNKSYNAMTTRLSTIDDDNTYTSTNLNKVEDADDDRFDWSGKQTGRLQSAFSWGYAPFMIFGGRLSELYGAKWIVLISGLGSALCSLLTPIIADHYYLLLASRVFMGICQTGVSPALYALCARWLPPEESSIYLPLIKVGVMIGMFSGALISGFLKWRMTFYVTGLIGLVWSIIWMLFVTSDPSEHNMVNKSELDYILDKIQELNKNRKLSARSSRNKSAPWLNIITNKVVIVFMLTKFTVKLATDTQSIELPMYLSNVFHVDKEINGLLTSINFGIQGLFTGLVAWLAKEMVCRKTFGLSKTGVRKLFQSICQFGCGFAFLLVSFNGCNINIVVIAIVLTSIACMFGSGGEAIIPIDLSNDYPASIMALANSLANLSGVLLPIIAFNILGDDVNDKESWNFVWTLVGCISISGGLLWLFFVEAELQDFLKPCGVCFGSTSSSSHTNKSIKEVASHQSSDIKTSRQGDFVMVNLQSNDNVTGITYKQK